MSSSSKKADRHILLADEATLTDETIDLPGLTRELLRELRAIGYTRVPEAESTLSKDVMTVSSSAVESVRSFVEFPTLKKKEREASIEETHARKEKLRAEARERNAIARKQEIENEERECANARAEVLRRFVIRALFLPPKDRIEFQRVLHQLSAPPQDGDQGSEVGQVRLLQDGSPNG